MSSSPRAGLLLLAVVTVVSGIWYFTADSASCNVSGAVEAGANGYYFAYDGYFTRRGYYSGRTLLDFFDLMNLRQFTSFKYAISLSPAGWVMLEFDTKEVIYESLPPDMKSGGGDTELPLYRPPETGWMRINYDDQRRPVSSAQAKEFSITCDGNLYDAKPEAPPSNLRMAMQQIGTYLILGGIIYYAWYLYSNAVDVGAVSYSYNKVVNEGEYWRGITASFAHFDLMHLGFNGMTLYQMAILETELGSIKYLYLSADLVVITMVLCTAMYWVMIYKMGREEQLHQQAVGYSCVLFAWIVVAALRMNRFCPIFFLPDFCFDTYTVPYVSLPLNLGPIVLLVITKFILPRSSFVGHLSGILIGLPLAWGWLDWLTPPVLLSALLATWLYHKQLDVRKYAAYGRTGSEYDSGGQQQYSQLPQASTHGAGAGGGGGGGGGGGVGGQEGTPLVPLASCSPMLLLSDSERDLLEGVADADEVSAYFRLKRASLGAVVWGLLLCAYALWGLLPTSTASPAFNGDPPSVLIGLGTLVTRGLLVFLAWSAPHAKRITLLSDNPATIRDNLLVLVLTSLYAALLMYLDFAALVLALANYRLVDASVSMGGMVLCLMLALTVAAQAWVGTCAVKCLAGAPPVEHAEVLRMTGTESVFSCRR